MADALILALRNRPDDLGPPSGQPRGYLGGWQPLGWGPSRQAWGVDVRRPARQQGLAPCSQPLAELPSWSHALPSSGPAAGHRVAPLASLASASVHLEG